MRKHALSMMSSQEIAQIPKQESVLLLPVGCVEQHGPAGYTGADTVLAEHVAEQVAEQLDNVYVAPPLWYGYTPYTDFPGTVTLRLETLQALVHDVVFGYFKHGFRRCVVMNNHGPNEAAIEPVAREIRQKYGASLAIFYPWKVAIAWARENVPEMSGQIGHGGEPTISVMMTLAPGTIDTSAPGQPGYVPTGDELRVISYRAARFEGQEVGLFSDPAAILPSGASGNWTAASEERGRIVLDYVVGLAVRFVKSFAAYEAVPAQKAG
jgi:creatinine amidohydrolase/Fe(II)-dependent formamide hydrolase-like protein